MKHTTTHNNAPLSTWPTRSPLHHDKSPKAHALLRCRYGGGRKRGRTWCDIKQTRHTTANHKEQVSTCNSPLSSHAPHSTATNTNTYIRCCAANMEAGGDGPVSHAPCSMTNKGAHAARRHLFFMVGSCVSGLLYVEEWAVAPRVTSRPTASILTAQQCIHFLGFVMVKRGACGHRGACYMSTTVRCCVFHSFV